MPLTVRRAGLAALAGLLGAAAVAGVVPTAALLPWSSLLIVATTAALVAGCVRLHDETPRPLSYLLLRLHGKRRHRTLDGSRRGRDDGD